jgi:MoaA/NifB/PqqE/SkfB family radical SAM enzyme
MNFIGKLKNIKMRFKEKFGNTYYRQLLRLGRMLIKTPAQSFDRGILKVMIGLTYDCQCGCNYCCVGLYLKEKEKELSTEEVKVLIYDISQLPSLFTLVSFFGGEPLLRNDIFDLVEFSGKRGLFTEIETNGILLSLNNVKKLKKAGLHHIFVRVEDSNSELHDKLSVFKGCFQNAVEGIKYCVHEGLPCSISTIATKDKIYRDELEKIIYLGRQLGVTSTRILYPTLSGKWLKESSQLLTIKEKDRIKRLLQPDFVYLESSYICSKEFDRICPAIKKKKFYVSCYGELQFCPFVPINFGNIRNEKINKILDKMWQDQIFKGADYNECLMNNIESRHKYFAKQT